ncbi:Flp family type IVb pilin [Pseudogulbenkiania subflava]|uniref:Pilus assembly protein Flp/PilA n=1 Tax=Pseudogulbenkiania subflava DSM 22618 TaxID=1123014 RepID=A0A1Y6BGU2_9NEIS|nr:Flp family type IVb pilin [Pseudogulbenkiania subflava]SMF10908.1 pilus assembly protein Flp/PilA [Pseudogulbenkiania subflava DSM 22618]
MSKLRIILKSIFDIEDGVTSIEYALLGSLIAMVILSAVMGLGTSLGALFVDVATEVGDAISRAL